MARRGNGLYGHHRMGKLNGCQCDGRGERVHPDPHPALPAPRPISLVKVMAASASLTHLLTLTTNSTCMSSPK